MRLSFNVFWIPQRCLAGRGAGEKGVRPAEGEGLAQLAGRCDFIAGLQQQAA